MNQPPTVVPTPPPQPAGQRRAQSAAGQTPAGTSDVAIRPLPELRRRPHSLEAGLRASDADAILQAVGLNRIDSARRKRLLTDLIGRFSNPLVVILLGAAAVSAFTGDVPSVLVITLIVLGSVILDVAQERRAENAAERLRERVSLTATALRDGKAVHVPAAQVVPGDIVLLAAGDLVPGGCKLRLELN